MSGLELAAIPASASVLAAVFPKAFDAILEALKGWEGRSKDIRNLKDQLCLIQGTIRDYRKIMRRVEDPSGSLQPWAATLQCIAYDIEDLIAGHRTMTSPERREKITFLESSVTSFKRNPIPNLGSQQTAGASSSSSTTSCSRTIFSNPQRNNGGQGLPLADLVGKEEHLRELLNLVRRPDTQFDMVLKVMTISVVGFGGIGETKLCHKLYQDVKNHGKFFPHAFVSAARKDDNLVLNEIIHQFIDQEETSASSGILHRVGQQFRGDRNHQVQQYISSLAQRLSKKRYLIVIDGVESEELVKFIACAFPENNMGSRIIMGMTVVGKDAERCDGHMCKMRPLQDEKSVTWFLNEAEQRPTFGFLDRDHSPSCLQKICDGVPLALVSVCEVHRGSMSTNAAGALEVACRELRGAEVDNWPYRMPLVLPHSYDSLHNPTSGNYHNQYIPYLQACLLYFAMFPRGNVRRGSLLRRWQAEGLQLGVGDKASHNLQTLIDRNFVWPLHVSMNGDQHAKTCQPPRVVLDYITRMSEDEVFILQSCPSEERNPNDTRRLSLHLTDPIGTPPSVITENSVPPRLRTLVVSWGHQQASCIAECKQLRVLDLESYPRLEQSHLEEICQKLKLLRYLSLQPDVISEVPSSIRKLQCLQTLEMGRENDKVVLVPIEVIQLPCLKHLIGKFELMHSLHKIPNRLWPSWVHKQIKKSNLERLSGFVTRKGQGFPPLMHHMRQLRKVKIWFHSDADAKSLKTYLPKAITKFLDKKDYIARSLSLDFHDCRNPEELLDSLPEAKGVLYSLKLCGKYLIQFPNMFVTDKFTGITKLCLRWDTIALDANFLAKLSKLDQLKYLKLDAETITGAYDENPPAGNNQAAKVVIDTGHIKKLERLCLVSKQKLPDIEIKPTALQKLVSLHLLSEDIDYCASHNMISKADGQAAAPLKELKEVALNATVPTDSKNLWHRAAREHPNKPQILCIVHPRRAG